MSANETEPTTDRMALLRRVSSEGYKLLTAPVNFATYSHENGRVILCFSGTTLQIDDDAAAALGRERTGAILTLEPDRGAVVAAFRDLVLDSLTPITVPETEVSLRASQFLSAFAPKATWRTKLPSTSIIPITVGTGLSDELNNEVEGAVTPYYVFLRSRFPNVRFECAVENPSYELVRFASEKEPLVDVGGAGASPDVSFVLHSSWNALARPGVGAKDMNPLIACGRTTDRLIKTSDGRVLIASRTFSVDRIFAPQYWTPAILPLLPPDASSPSGQLTALLRSSSSLTATCVATSALLASLSPVLSTLIRSPLLGFILSVIGSVCALVGMAALALEKVVLAMDAASAKVALAKGKAKSLQTLAQNGDLTGLLGGAGGLEDEAKVDESEILNGKVFQAGKWDGMGSVGDLLRQTPFATTT